MAVNASVLDCTLTLPDNVLTAAGLATPFQLQPPCSMTVGTQQAYAEAAIFDPATNSISIYHPLVIDAGTTPPVAPVVPTLANDSVVALWFGFNGLVLELLDTRGMDTNQSPTLQAIDCVNGLPGVSGDIFGQVSWCNTQPFFAAANNSIAAGSLIIPDIGTDSQGNPCPTSRSFEIVDACPSDNVPTQYILLPDGTTVQDTATNRATYTNGTVINNASDEALLANILDPLIGCTPFLNPSVDDPGSMVPSLAGNELQAAVHQAAPAALIALNDPDTVLTSSGAVSADKTNAYRLGVNQGLLGNGPNTDNGSLSAYCDNMVSVAPSWLLDFQQTFTGQTTPDDTVGSDLFTFLCERYLMSLQQLTCATPTYQPVTCAADSNGVATSCAITLTPASTVASTAAVSATTAPFSNSTVTIAGSGTLTAAGTLTTSGALTAGGTTLTTATLSATRTTATAPPNRTKFPFRRPHGGWFSPASPTGR